MVRQSRLGSVNLCTMIIKHFTLLCLLFSLATISSAQTPAPSDVHVKLSLAENKTVYRIGEPIKLVMEFTADREGYVIEVFPDREGPASDTIAVSPEMGVTQWFAEMMDNRYPGRCVLSTEIDLCVDQREVVETNP
jgi:hypothetical protein